ncbi:unnamed protein product [Symbiodinium natans]|uniref:Uncharacterized protein n=1 Tax=Symbiodinium natans TaxID=878477 RepID=A0A812K2Z9_9DINO|nr:unnamed protein product [Symbiodinium natans]
MAMTLLTLSNGDQDNTLCKEKSKVCVHLELVNGQEKEEAKIWVSPQACIGEVKQQAEDELQVVISKLQLPSGCFIDGHRSVEEERLDENVKIRALVATREDLDFKMRLQQALEKEEGVEVEREHQKRVKRIVFLPGSEHFDPVAIHTVMVSGKEEKQCNFRKGKALWSPTRPMDLERGIDADYPQYLV